MATRLPAYPPTRHFTGMDLTTHLTGILRSLRLPAGPALVAVSGGPDSVALLDLLVETRGSHGLELIVVHADHGIHPDSGEVGVDPMIGVDDDQLEPMRPSGLDEEVEEGDRIGATGNGDQRRSRREAERAEDTGQVGGQVHPCKVAGRRVGG